MTDHAPCIYNGYVAKAVVVDRYSGIAQLAEGDDADQRDQGDQL